MPINVPVAGRLGLFVATLWALTPAPARADVLITPFLGVKFGGSTSIVDLEQAASAGKRVFGIAAAVLGRGIVGVESELAFVPGYFERGTRDLITSSYVVDLTGSVILTVPPGLTREGLRPYAVVGAGVIHAEASDILDVFRIRRSVPALNLGVGATGIVTNRAGVRFDARYLRSISRSEEALVAVGRRIGYWRASIGVVLRY